METSVYISFAGVLISGLVAFITASIRIGIYKNKVDTLVSEVSDLKREVKDLSAELIKCSTKIDERTRSYSSTLTKRESPISLSENGKTLLSKSGADRFVLENQEDLVNKIREKNPHSAYDVQSYARAVVEEIQNEPRFKPFKDFAFKEGVNLEPIFIVMSLFLRDIALPLLGYKLEEVDHGDPTLKTN